MVPTCVKALCAFGSCFRPAHKWEPSLLIFNSFGPLTVCFFMNFSAFFYKMDPTLPAHKWEPSLLIFNSFGPLTVCFFMNFSAFFYKMDPTLPSRCFIILRFGPIIPSLAFHHKKSVIDYKSTIHNIP